MDEPKKAPNTFQSGMNLDASDMVLKNTQARWMLNFRLISLNGSSYVATNIKGTETKFQITSGFEPVAIESFNSILYLALWNPTTNEFEVGSYPSPNYASPGGDIWVYRPFNNLDSGAFKTSLYGYSSRPVINKLTIQPDYDGSVNLCFPVKGKIPRIINSKFEVVSSGDGNVSLSVIPERTGAATSNEYSSSTLLKETTLVVYSDKILGISFPGLEDGGKLKPGNYFYVFNYMTEDFAKTAVVGQSGLCQVAFGSTEASMRGGDQTEETSKQITLNLTNVDTNFKYLKVYVVYSSGTEAVEESYYEMTAPIEIISETMTFTHNGYEELDEVSSEVVDLDYSTIEAVDTAAHVGGFYFLGGISQTTYDYTAFKTAAAALEPTCLVKEITPGIVPGYADPKNVYDYLGNFGGESYPYGIVFVMPGGVLSPVFPIQGKLFSALGSGTDQDNGIITYPKTNVVPHFKSGNIQSRHVRFNMSSIPTTIKNESVGFFFVRGERKKTAIGQGLVIPTMKVPNGEYLLTDTDTNNTYWETFKSSIDDTTVFKFAPVLDSLLEAYVREMRDDGNTAGGDYDYQAIDEFNNVKDGYMPIFIKDTKLLSGGPEIWYSKSTEAWARHWALISGEGLLNEPEAISLLNNRQSAAVQQISKVQFQVKGEITPMAHLGPWNDSTARTGLHYDFFNQIFYSSPSLKIAKSISYVPGELYNTGSAFSSRIRATVYAGHYEPLNPDGEAFDFVDMMMNSYFGIEMLEGTSGMLADATKGFLNPIGGNNRISTYGKWTTGANGGPSSNNGMSAGTNYNNIGQIPYAAFLVNIYPSGVPPTPAQLYPSIDNISYRQITPRIAWGDLPSNQLVSVFGGDCFVSKISRRLNQCSYRNRSELITDYTKRSNINSGITVSWWQESKYNLHLRQPSLFDDSEPEKRTFFPLQGLGDHNVWRSNRYPETLVHSPGYAKTLTPKSHFPAPSLAPFIKNEFFSRIQPSERHIPNAFRNGFRSYISSKARDYASSMGRITSLLDHRNNLFVVFEHGLGITPVEQRVETAPDGGGGVFIDPSDILPPQLGYPSREIGSQDHLSIVQTPSAIYGVDRSRFLIWQFRDSLKVISDESVSSFLKLNPPINPRSGYDPENKEVIFTTDNWTLAFREGMEDNAPFYFLSFAPDFYARRNNDFYSFIGRTAYKHNAETYLIYGEQKRSFVEFVLNENLNLAKALEYIEIISNEIPPEKIEVYSYNQDVEKREAINTSSLNQYGKVLYEFDVVKDEYTMKYRNKRWLIPAPLREIYNSGSILDDWDADESKMTDKYLIVRVTYNTTQPIKLASVISNYNFANP